MIDARDLAPFHAHGGRVEVARATFGGDDWIDLSTGIAPWAWPADRIALGLERLPEPAAIAGLEAAAAAAFGVDDPARVVAVPGTDLAMRMLADVVGAARPAVVVPGYAGHRAAWPAAVAVEADDIVSLAGKAGREIDLLVLASPANPDGRVSDPGMLRALSQRMTVVIDEAYADPDRGLCPHASDRLIVLRSFGKFYGLPGVRLGFVVAGRDVAAGLRARLGDWPVSSAAVAVGTAAYHDRCWSAAQRTRIAETALALDHVLAGATLSVIGTAPLFRLVNHPAAVSLFACLARHAILTRPFADHADRLRIGLPRGMVGLARLASALEEFTS